MPMTTIGYRIHELSAEKAILFSDFRSERPIFKYEYTFSDIIMGFLDNDLDLAMSRYSDILHSMINICSKKDSHYIINELNEWLDLIDKEFPHFVYYTGLVYLCLHYVITSEKELKVHPLLRTLEGGKVMLATGKYMDFRKDIGFPKIKNNIAMYFELIIDSISKDISILSGKINATIERIIESAQFEGYSRLSANQRLLFYYLHLDPISFVLINHGFEVTNHIKYYDSHIADFIKQHSTDLSEVLKMDQPVIESYVIKTPWDIFILDFIKVILLDIPLNKCAYCGRIFIPQGRRTAKYCNRIAPGEIQPCEAIGAMRLYQNRVSNDPVYIAYNKAYQRKNARIRQNKLTRRLFQSWAQEAREMREKCLNGEITLEEFNKWLGNKTED